MASRAAVRERRAPNLARLLRWQGGIHDDAARGHDRLSRVPIGGTPELGGGNDMKHLRKSVTGLVAAVTAAALAASLAPAGGAASGGSLVKAARSPFGRVLVDSRGITLYDFPRDRGIVSSCYGACAALWPPLLTSGKPVAGPGVRASLLGTTKRSDGKIEVTYNGHPLYYFVSDRSPGHFSGQGLKQFGDPWWVLSPAGEEIHHVYDGSQRPCFATSAPSRFSWPARSTSSSTTTTTTP